MILAVARPAASQSAPDRGSSTEGSYELQLTTRTFDSPLFDGDSTGSFRLWGNQWLGNEGELTLWLDSGFPNFTTDFGLQLERASGTGSRLRLNAGDFLLTPLLPAQFTATSRDSYPLQGIRLHRSGESSQWTVFGGRAKRFRHLPGNSSQEPTLYGGRYLKRRGSSHYGLSLIAVQNPTFAEADDAGGLTAVVSGEYLHQISLRTGLFTELLASESGGVAGRLGSRLRFQPGELAASVYAFDESFPYVDPLFRPGERGAEVAGRYRLTELLTLSGHLNWVRDAQTEERSDLRAQLGVGWSLGSDRPHFHLSYARNEVAFDSRSIAREGSAVDRVTLSITESSASELFNFNLEHLMAEGDGSGDRSQALLTYRRLLGADSFLDGSVLAQHDANSDFGITAEASLERPLRGPYHYRVGVGGAFVDRSGENSADGALRLGLSRRILRNGWSATVEAVFPFSIGLPASGLARRQIVFALGHSMAWNSLAALPSLFGWRRSAQRVGRIEGAVRFPDGESHNLTIFVNGEPRATTAGDGTFRITRVPAGTATLTLDTRQLDPRYSVLGGPSRRIEVVPGEVAGLELVIRELSYFQGSLLVCEGEEARPLAGAEVSLVGEDAERRVTTSRLGGFFFDQIPPGAYELVLDSHSVVIEVPGRTPTRWRVDLSEDVAGHILRLGCPEGP